MEIKQYDRNEINKMSRNRLQERYNSLYIENRELRDKLKCKSLYELGFKKHLGEKVYTKEARQWRENGLLKIEFDEQGNQLCCISFNDTLPVFLNIDELKAIILEMEIDNARTNK